MDGVIQPRFPIAIKQITDGTSNTLIAAEKFLHPDFYPSGSSADNSCTDNNTLYQGYDWDNIRWMTTRDGLGPSYAPRPDSTPDGEACSPYFGSAHPGGFNAVMCDGSVRTISYDIDHLEFELLCRRNDR